MIAFAGFHFDVSRSGPDWFPMSGSLILAIAIGSYFFLEWRDFFTGMSGDLFDAFGHYVPRNIVAPINMVLSVSGTLIWGFGNLAVNLAICGALACE